MARPGTPPPGHQRPRLLARVVGWEAFIVLHDIRGLDDEQARQVSLSAALAPD